MTKRILIVASLVLAVGLAAAAQEVGVRARIPFNFFVLEKTLPPGEYTLTSVPHELRISDANHRLVAVVLANEISGRSAATSGQLIFHCYGDRCFLSELQSPTEGNGRQLLMSRLEAGLAKGQTEKYFAVLSDGPKK